MNKIILDEGKRGTLTIMIFVEGTIVKPKSWRAMYNHNAYIPIGNAVSIIRAWYLQDTNIIFCTSRRKQHAQEVVNIINKYGFKGACLVYREEKETYQHIVEMIAPDILIEDDCRSIGGAWQMCITKVNAEQKKSIQSIVVKEFKGIDHLPLDLEKLKKS